MWWTEPGGRAAVSLPLISKTCVAILTIATLVFGVWPQPILALLR
jgi:NADH:ubiquinone oxidoreductase subunit 2 (subunit N)